MNNFTHHSPTRVHFGKGQIEKLAGEFPVGSKILLTFGGGSIKSNGVYEQVKSALANFQVIEFGGIEPNPHHETLIKAVSLAKDASIDYILAVGGGSVVDGSKFIAAAICYEGDSWDILTTYGACVERAIPLGCVLTLPATGSEMNSGAVVTKDKTKDKLFFRSDTVIPRFAILDPETTFSLPPRQIANGVVDSFVHTVEQYVTYPVNALVQDGFAESILKTIISQGPLALERPTDYDVRANLMWAATNALNGTLSNGVPEDWATHMIGHELTGLYGLDHAQTLAIVIPALWKYKKQQKLDKLVQFGQQVWNITGSTKEEIADAAIAKTEEFFVLMGNPTTLSAYHMDATHIPAVLEKLELHGHTQLGEHGDITLKDVKEILALAL
ncbi:iron-containing alcohol dehydrogenase [Rheinheimera mangrovi]|uniref:iron-containing alcohol dehydrogenase n=1 Tax=Rheinheimera mangrovi TaxID=2498451 RepID=UPI000F8D0A14|nr:iron-containing alcohol dehydrogenase [Rheinheimera mangrovi]